MITGPLPARPAIRIAAWPGPGEDPEGNGRDETHVIEIRPAGDHPGARGAVGVRGAAEGPEPIAYTVRFPSPEKHIAEVEAVVPTEGRPAVELMMAVWSPGFYRVEDYARKVEGLSARTPDGMALEVEATRKNRWRIVNKGGAAKVVVSYRLTCDRRSVTLNWVAPDLIVLNGAAAFVTAVEPDGRRRPHEVRLELPPGCRRSATAMDAAPGGRPDHYRARDYDTLVDSPIVAGTLSTHEFTVEGSRHILVDAGDVGAWDGGLAARTWRRWSARPGGSGASSPSSDTSSSTSSAAEQGGWSTRTRPC